MRGGPNPLDPVPRRMIAAAILSIVVFASVMAPPAFAKTAADNAADTAADNAHAGPRPRIRLRGWWLNTSPQNVVLFDGRREWPVSRQGDGGASGEWPRFPASRWVSSGTGGYGHGCALIDAGLDGERVGHLYAAAALPLARCRKTAVMRGIERSFR